MAGRGSDPLRLRCVLRDVTLLAHSVRHMSVLVDFLRAFLDPEVELPHARADGLLVAVMTCELRVLALSAGHALDRSVHDVAAHAEVVRVLRVVPGCCSCAGGSDEQYGGAHSQADLQRRGTGDEPVPDWLSA